MREKSNVCTFHFIDLTVTVLLHYAYISVTSIRYFSFHIYSFFLLCCKSHGQYPCTVARLLQLYKDWKSSLKGLCV